MSGGRCVALMWVAVNARAGLKQMKVVVGACQGCEWR